MMKVSVIICTHNQAHYIKAAISSVLSNTYQNFELLIIDHSSDELTKQIAQAYANKDSRVKYFYPPSQKTTCMQVDECEEKTASEDVTKWASCSRSKGITPTSMPKLSKRISAYLTSRGKFRYHGLARGVFHMSTMGSKCRGLNYGIKMAQGEVIAITDSDCQVAEDWIEKIVFVFNRHPDVDIVYGSLIPEKDSEKKWFVPGVVVKDRIFSGPRSKIFENGMGANMAIRKRLFDKIGYFDEFLGPGSLFCGGDEWDFSYRALKNGSKVAHSSLIKVRHFGRRDKIRWEQLLKGYRIADAAVFFKHIRCFDLNAVYVLIGMYLVYIHRIIKSTDFNNKGLIQKIAYKFYMFLFLSFCFLKGIVLSIKFPVDRRRQIFYSPGNDYVED